MTPNDTTIAPVRTKHAPHQGDMDDCNISFVQGDSSSYNHGDWMASTLPSDDDETTNNKPHYPKSTCGTKKMKVKEGETCIGTRMGSPSSALSRTERMNLFRTCFPQEVVDVFYPPISPDCAADVFGGFDDDGSVTSAGADTSVTSSPSCTDTIAPPHHEELIEAIQKVPHLVRDETPIENYILEFSKNRGASSSGGVNNSTATNRDKVDKETIRQAAIKVANHWKLRKQFFRERAFFPMVQTTTTTNTSSVAASAAAISGCSNGADNSNSNNSTRKRRGEGTVVGALSEEDMEWYNTGFMALLPSTTDPIQKRTVIAFDYSRLPPGHNSCQRYNDIKLRLVFYILYVASTTNLYITQTKGIAVLSVETSQPSPYYGNWSLRIAREAFPVKHIEINALFLPSKVTTTGTQSIMHFAIPIVKYLFDLVTKHTYSAKAHFGLSDECVMEKLVDSGGFNRADVPSWCGGYWDMDQFQLSRTKQLKMEKRRYKTLPLTSEGEYLRKLRLSEKYKAKRARAKAKQENLLRTAKRLKQANEKMKEENERLAGLLDYAEAEICILDGLPLQQYHHKDDAIIDHDDGNEVGTFILQPPPYIQAPAPPPLLSPPPFASVTAETTAEVMYTEVFEAIPENEKSMQHFPW